MSTPVARSDAAIAASSPLGWLTQQGLRGMARREALTGYLFILPTYLGFLLFVLGPVIASLGLSFYDWDLLAQKPPEFVGCAELRQPGPGRPAPDRVPEHGPVRRRGRRPGGGAGRRARRRRPERALPAADLLPADRVLPPAGALGRGGRGDPELPVPAGVRGHQLLPRPARRSSASRGSTRQAGRWWR